MKDEYYGIIKKLREDNAKLKAEFRNQLELAT